jgi:hypothetical protein
VGVQQARRRVQLDAVAGDAGVAPQRTNPWSVATVPGGNQWLVGGSWTGESQFGVLVEAWHDGTAIADATWNDWMARNRALAASPAPMAARAGNLAWQTSPLGASSLRQDNLYLRLSWQATPWQVALDTLLTPADHGRIGSATLQWQGDRVRLDAGVRVYGGPPGSVFAQLPVRRVGLVAATWAW